MSIRGLVLAFVLVGVLGLAWHRRIELRAWASATAQPASSAPLRKCVKGQQVTYSNVECAAGHTEQPINAAPVNVLPAMPAAKPAQTGSSAPSSLRKALDVSGDETLREKAMERAINGSR